MSGNPFRRKDASRLPDENTHRDAPTPPPIKTSSKKKTVTIQTPPQSPEDVPRRLSSGRISPPPAQTASEEDDSDSTATADSDLEQALQNTRRNSGSLPPPSSLATFVPGAPYNPFARTLATSEAAFGLQQARDEQQERGLLDGEEQSRPGPGGPAMDMNAFKTILMTGSGAPSPPVSTPSQRFPDSSSSTDTSSVSRNSLFDHMHELHPESPRTSFDQMDSPSEDDDDDDEDSKLMVSESRLDDLAPPAPPKQTHGKAPGPRGPQTVSFADFDESGPAWSTSRVHTPPINTDLKSILRLPIVPRSPSDLNKPLPAPPEQPENRQAESGVSEPDSSQSQQPTPTTAASSKDVSYQKKAPPPPPVSRRAGQSGPNQGRARSTSNATQDSTREEEGDESQTPAESTPKVAAPPPPPSRKTKPATHTPSPAVATPVVTPPESPSPVPPAAESKAAMPPPPPRRNQSRTGNAVRRSPSNASQSSIRRSDNQTASSQPGPPAPPPRRGANSKRESMEGAPNAMSWANQQANGTSRRRSSGNSFDSERSISASNLQQVAEAGEKEESIVTSPAESGASRDILADMSAFQAEIDALRARADKDR